MKPKTWITLTFGTLVITGIFWFLGLGPFGPKKDGENTCNNDKLSRKIAALEAKIDSEKVRQIGFFNDIHLPPTPPQPKIIKIPTSKSEFGKAVDVTYYDFTNRYPSPVLMLVDSGLRTEKLIECNREGLWLMKGDKKEKLEKLPLITTEQFKSIEEDFIEVQVVINKQY